MNIVYTKSDGMGETLTKYDVTFTDGKPKAVIDPVKIDKLLKSPYLSEAIQISSKVEVIPAPKKKSKKKSSVKD